jgi:Fe-S cluster assembly protein SufD
LGQQPGQQEVFTALNSAGLTDTAVIWAKGDQGETPIHLLFLSLVSETSTFSQPRILVVAEKDAKLRLIESYGAISSNCSDIPQNLPYFTNPVSEIYLKEDAQLEHIRVQRESGDCFHIARTAVSQGRNSRYSCVEVNLGAQLSRHQLDIYQNETQTETSLYGLAMLEDKQVSDSHSAVYLNHPYGIVDQLHKCIVDAQAQGVFNGKIIVPKAAQMTNAAQMNRNLLLSPKASINTKPELQITADNVKCTHGATVSQLEADELFYLRSRGLSEDSARNLLIDAFAAEILAKIPFPSLQKRLNQCVACRTLY